MRWSATLQSTLQEKNPITNWMFASANNHFSFKKRFVIKFTTKNKLSKRTRIRKIIKIAHFLGLVFSSFRTPFVFFVFFLCFIVNWIIKFASVICRRQLSLYPVASRRRRLCCQATCVLGEKKKSFFLGKIYVAMMGILSHEV